ncbi:MAG: hypothetical protein JF609_03475 [Verrucomicrobia bacterium]|nr:hypothetical protein [Verrucomicrobiota bacterium]
MDRLVKNWLQVVPWEVVVSINAVLCDARKALHKPTSDGYQPAKELWEQNRPKKLTIAEVLELGFRCHRLAPFCNYNGNTFVTIVKTLLQEELNHMPADRAQIFRSIAGHIVAGTATEVEREQLDAIVTTLEK